LHDPTILLLDEPPSGLDPKLIIEFRELTKSLSRMGKTNISYRRTYWRNSQLSAIKIGIIEKGKLLASGSITQINAMLKPQRKIPVRMLDNYDTHTKNWP